MSGAKAVREDRLWQRHADMAKLGGTPKGGVNRQALSPEDAAARNLLASWAKARGFAIFTDAIGNLFVRREGSDAEALPVMSGSHMDSQPTGGRFDGMYGVLAAFEALEALEDAGLRTRRPVIAVAWTNEEGSRFQPGAMGSAVFAGRSRLDDMLAVKDWKGVVLKDALAETLKAAPAPMREGTPGFPLDGYVEAHIEQGPRLENARKTIGVVTGIQGSRRYIVEIAGRGGACRHDAARRPQGRLRRRHAHRRGDVRGDDRRRRHAALHHRAGRGLSRLAQHRAGQGELHHRHAPSRRTPCWRRTSRRCWPSWPARAAPCTARIDRVTAMPPTDFDLHGHRPGARQGRCAGAQQHGHAVGRRPRRHAHRPALPGRHDLRALRARHQPQRDRERHARRPRRRRARAGRGAGGAGQS